MLPPVQHHVLHFARVGGGGPSILAAHSIRTAHLGCLTAPGNRAQFGNLFFDFFVKHFPKLSRRFFVKHVFLPWLRDFSVAREGPPARANREAAA